MSRRASPSAEGMASKEFPCLLSGRSTVIMFVFKSLSEGGSELWKNDSREALVNSEDFQEGAKGSNRMIVPSALIVAMN